MQEIFIKPPNYVNSNNSLVLIFSIFVGREAGDIYVKAAETEIKSGEADGSARKFLNASTCYKKIDPERTKQKESRLFSLLFVVAISCLLKANAIFIKNGRFHIAATHEKEIAEIYEQTLNEQEKAIKFYLSAADRFSIDDSLAIAQGCSIKAASISAEIGKYEEAAKLFENNAEESSNDQLRKYSVKDYLFRAGLCRLCLDVKKSLILNIFILFTLFIIFRI